MASQKATHTDGLSGRGRPPPPEQAPCSSRLLAEGNGHFEAALENVLTPPFQNGFVSSACSHESLS